jgi:hypothetical protein
VLEARKDPSHCVEQFAMLTRALIGQRRFKLIDTGQLQLSWSRTIYPTLIGAVIQGVGLVQVRPAHRNTDC